MRKIILFFIYSGLLLIIGRNISFLPEIDLKDEKQETQDIKRKAQQFILQQKGAFSIYYKDVETNQEFGINENRILTAASLNKLAIISYLYHLATEGKIDLEEKVVVQKEDIQDYGTGILRYNGIGEAYTLKTLAQYSLEKSDNTAAHILGIKLGIDNIQKYIKDLGLLSTEMLNNKTTTKDMGKLLSLIYSNKISSRELTAELLDFLKDTDQEDRLPRYLEKNASVFHKTADAVNMIHDVGIIKKQNNSFILSVMTTEIKDEEEAKRAIGTIAKIIYEERNK